MHDLSPVGICCGASGTFPDLPVPMRHLLVIAAILVQVSKFISANSDRCPRINKINNPASFFFLSFHLLCTAHGAMSGVTLVKPPQRVLTMLRKKYACT